LSRATALRAFGGRHLALWALPLALVLLNVGWLLAFGSGSRVRAGELDRRAERARHEHEQVAHQLAAREQLWIAATDDRAKIETLYRDRFSTERARFTDAVRELKSLAQRSGLVPKAISYPEEKLEAYGLVRRSFVFGVEGSYAQLRSFLHLVELSRTFFVVEQISVSESGRGLGIQLRLSTLFATGEPAASGSAAPESAPASGAASQPAAGTDEAAPPEEPPATAPSLPAPPPADGSRR